MIQRFILERKKKQVSREWENWSLKKTKFLKNVLLNGMSLKREISLGVTIKTLIVFGYQKSCCNKPESIQSLIILSLYGVVPTIEALAQAPEEKLLKAWEGLGYYSRARNIQAAAKTNHGRF